MDHLDIDYCNTKSTDTQFTYGYMGTVIGVDCCSHIALRVHWHLSVHIIITYIFEIKCYKMIVLRRALLCLINTIQVCDSVGDSCSVYVKSWG